MKRAISILLFFLTFISTLSGCSDKKKAEPPVEETIQKNYKEFKVQGPELNENEIYFSIGKNRENQLEYYTIDYSSGSGFGVLCYTLVDGAYQKESLDWINRAVEEKEIYPNSIYHGEDGNDYMLAFSVVPQTPPLNPEDIKILYSVFKKTEAAPYYADVTPSDWHETEGTVERVEGIAVGRIDITKDQIMCYKEDYQGNLVFYDLTTKKKVDMGEFEVASNYVIQDNTLYYLPYDSAVIRIHPLNSDTEEEIERKDIPFESLLQVSPDGSIVMLETEGIHKYAKDGTEWETIFDGKQGSMSTPSYELSDFELISGDDDTYYVVYRDNVKVGEVLFAKYTSSEDGGNEVVNENQSTPDSQTELTIYSMYDNTTLRQAIAEYNRVHPEITFNYEVAMQGSDDANRADIIRTLNTKILAGDGADLFLMDGLPMESYVQKGVLMDLSDILMESIQNQTFNQNISNNYVRDGSVYTLPMRYYMPVYAMAKDITEDTKTVEDLAAYCKDKDQNVIEELSYELLTQQFLYTYWNEIFTEDGLLDEERLSSFLTSMDTIAKQTGAQKEGFYGTDMGESGVQGANSRMRKILCGGDFLLMYGDIDASVTFIGDIANMTQLYNVVKEVNGCYTSVNDTFVPNGLVGINKATKEAEAAKEFVAYLFSDEVQSLHLNDGFPINNIAMKAWIESEEPEMTYGFSSNNESGRSVQLMYGSLTVEEKQSMDERIKMINRPVYNDYIVMDMIHQESVLYLSGEKSLDEAVSDIMAKVNLYLKE